MSAGPTGHFNHQLDRLLQAGTLSGLSDAELLRQFNGSRTPAAERVFEVLVDRHGPMVLAVCRGILKRPQDAEDAFQATFLILVRKAGAIRVGGSLAPWLYAVAHRTAARLRSQGSRLVSADPATLGSAVGGELPDCEVGPLVHQELAGLPEKYRAPIVLCHLEGKSHEEAARLLDWPVGTLSGRLSRGRQVLKGRLERRGLGPAGMLIGPLAGHTPAPVPASLAQLTIANALITSTASTLATVAPALATGVANAMLQTRLSRLLLVLGSLCTVGAAVILRPVWSPVVFGGGPQEGSPTLTLTPTRNPTPNPATASGGMMAGMMGSGEMGGMMGMMMGGPSLMNAPNLVPNSAIQLTRSTNLIVVETEDGKALAAMDSRADREVDWARYEIPQGISVTPVVSEDLATFIARGDSVTEIAAFGPDVPRWIIQKLLHPVKEQISPAVAHGFVLFQEGQTFYAFSRSIGKWDVLKLDGPEPASATMNPTDVTVVQGNRLYVFPLGTARWTKEIVVKRASGTP